MKFLKKMAIIFVSLFCLFWVVYGIAGIYGRIRFGCLLNWHLVLPKPLKEEVIFDAGWSDMIEADVLYYKNNDFVQKMNKLSKFNKEDIALISDKLNHYLYLVEVFGEENTKLLNDKVDITTLLNEDNYYFYKQDKENKNKFLIILADTQNNCLYLLESVC